VDHVVKRIRDRVKDNPLYLSIDIDVLDPAHAPGTGTPEIAGMTSRELVNIIRGLKGLNLIAADIVEVAPAYDHAEITSLAAATIAFEMINLIAFNRDAKTG
jgi:agmatinase